MASADSVRASRPARAMAASSTRQFITVASMPMVSPTGRGVPRPVGDTMGMLATVMNCLVLEAAIERAGREARTLSALAMTAVCETYSRKRAMKNLGKGRVVLLAAGTGNPYFTTDTTAVLRAAELGCEAVLKATNVDGVYTADPKKDPKAKRYDKLGHQEAIEKDLRVMDSTCLLYTSPSP